MVAQFPGVSIHLQEHWANYFQILLIHEKETSRLLADWSFPAHKCGGEQSVRVKAVRGDKDGHSYGFYVSYTTATIGCRK